MKSFQSRTADHDHTDSRVSSGGATSDAINTSPRQVAQRQTLAGLFGSAIELQQETQEELRPKSSLLAQRRGLDEGESLQGKDLPPPAALQRQGDDSSVVAGENRTGMPDQLKENLEVMSGFDLSDVRVHRNSDKPAQLSALAYAQGNEIFLGPGQERLLPHEAWHTVQQKQGKVRATMQMQTLAVNNDDLLEGEADGMAARAMSNPLREDGSWRSGVDAAHLLSEKTSIESAFPSRSGQSIQRVTKPVVAQMTWQEDIEDAFKNISYFKNESSTSVEVFTNLAQGVIDKEVKEEEKKPAADGLRNFSQTLNDTFDARKAELYEAELLAGQRKDRLVVLCRNDITGHDVFIGGGKDGDGIVVEVKTLSSDEKSGVSDRISKADDQLGSHKTEGSISEMRIKLRIESRENVWPAKRNGKPLSDEKLAERIKEELENLRLKFATEVYIEGINHPEQKRKFMKSYKYSYNVTGLWGRLEGYQRSGGTREDAGDSIPSSGS